MSFATLVARVRYEFTEIPSLEVTMAQAVRRWRLGADDCRYVVDALVDTGFLRWTPQRTIVRAGRRGTADARTEASAHISVMVHTGQDNSVGTA